MRLLHMTDVHFFQPPRLRGMFGKRALGMANMYASGRRHYFDARAIVAKAVADAENFDFDAFVMTGDLTAMSQEVEFAEAREAFGPLLEAVPSIVVPGNHDLYTRGARSAARMERFFGAWMAGGTWDDERFAWAGGVSLREGEETPWPVCFRLGDTDFIATNPCRPAIRSTGFFGDEAIEKAASLIRASRTAGQQVVYLLHYPPLNGEGDPYRREGHCIEDVDRLLASLRDAPPDLILHGHRHEAWRVDLQAGTRAVPILNCGTTSAVSPLPDRTAGYFVIELEGGELRSVRRRILLPDTVTFTDHPSSWGAEGASA